jgi:Ser/Thr protein kinase RdoA (MazF antagonist)
MELERLFLQFEHLTPTVDDYGLVHGDLNPTNFHVNDNQITLFDFDDCAYKWFINDIAIALPLYSGIFTHMDLEDQMTNFFQLNLLGLSMSKFQKQWIGTGRLYEYRT